MCPGYKMPDKWIDKVPLLNSGEASKSCVGICSSYRCIGVGGFPWWAEHAASRSNEIEAVVLKMNKRQAFIPRSKYIGAHKIPLQYGDKLHNNKASN